MKTSPALKALIQILRLPMQFVCVLAADTLIVDFWIKPDVPVLLVSSICTLPKPSRLNHTL